MAPGSVTVTGFTNHAMEADFEDVLPALRDETFEHTVQEEKDKLDDELFLHLTD